MSLKTADSLSVVFSCFEEKHEAKKWGLTMKIGFIGAGNMGGAILRGAIKAGFITAEEVMVFDTNQELLASLRNEYNIRLADSNAVLAQMCEWIVLAVKPVFLQGVLEEISPFLKEKNVISIAAGWSVAMLKNALDGSGARILRVMPNTPALVGAGMTALCTETDLCDADFEWAKKLFSTLGMVQLVPERLFDAVIAVSGSSPAYVFMFIEAMADAAVKLGMPRKMAIESAAQAVYGSAQMVLKTHEHPAVLKDNVCSPGGTTIEAVQTLEENGFRGAVMRAMEDCAKKNQSMAQAQKKGKEQ